MLDLEEIALVLCHPRVLGGTNIVTMRRQSHITRACSSSQQELFYRVSVAFDGEIARIVRVGAVHAINAPVIVVPIVNVDFLCWFCIGSHNIGIWETAKEPGLGHA